MSEQKYDVFISYAHADAQTDEQKALVNEIKSAIEAALGGHYVFLDSEALVWGDEWSAKIRECIDNCRVFVYLLSPNYLRSDYCQREKLWWAKREIDKGRLNKATRPIYYISLPLTGDEQTDRYIRELKICQADDSPFFESLDEVKCDIARERIDGIRKKIKEQVDMLGGAEESDCTVYPRLSRFFVGRLEDLAKLHQLCCISGSIPVISGAAGIGKSELAVAYAYAYAENFPQGRFMIPMQGVTDWTAAMDKMVEKIRECGKNPEDFGLPEELAKQNPEVRRKAAWRWLRNRAEKGGVLLLLDNLEELELIYDDAVLEFTEQVGLPSNLHIVATTRLNEQEFSSRNLRNFYEPAPMSEKDALEFFCLIGENVFPFAKYPMSGDGKILLDEVPPEERPADITGIEAEYAAAKEIVRLLGGHAWSLEIVAGFMAKNPAPDGFRKKREELSGASASIIGTTYRGGKYQDPEKLLRPTLEQLMKFDGIAENLGEKILTLALIASFFPPEQVPRYALEGIWKRKFGDDTIVWDRGTRQASSGCLALESLRKYRIVNGDGPILKMHRLTRKVLQDSFLDQGKELKKEKLAFFFTMDDFLWDWLLKNDAVSPEEILPWYAWALDWLAILPSANKDEYDLCSLRLLISELITQHLFTEADVLLRHILAGKAFCSGKMRALFLRDSARLNRITLRYLEAENELRQAIAEYSSTGEASHWDVVKTRSEMAYLYFFQNLYEKAAQIYHSIASDYEQLLRREPDCVQMVLLGLQNFYASLIYMGKLEKARAIYSRIAAIRTKYPVADAVLPPILGEHLFEEEKYALDQLKQYENQPGGTNADGNYEIFNLLKFLGDIHADMLMETASTDDRNHYARSAEAEYRRALEICGKFSDREFCSRESEIGDLYYRIADIHIAMLQTAENENQAATLEQIEHEFGKSIDIYRHAAEKEPYYYEVAGTAQRDLAVFLFAHSRSDAAVKVMLNALADFDAVAEKCPEERRRLSREYLQMALLFRRNTTFTGETEKCYAKAIEFLRAGKLCDADVRTLLLARAAFADYLLSAGKLEQSVREILAARTEWERAGEFFSVDPETGSVVFDTAGDIVNELERQALSEEGQVHDEQYLKMALDLSSWMAKENSSYAPEQAYAFYLIFLAVVGYHGEDAESAAEKYLAAAVNIAHQYPQNAKCKRILDFLDQQ